MKLSAHGDWDMMVGGVEHPTGNPDAITIPHFEKNHLSIPDRPEDELLSHAVYGSAGPRRSGEPVEASFQEREPERNLLAADQEMPEPLQFLPSGGVSEMP